MSPTGPRPRAARLSGESAFRVLARARELERAGREIIHLEIGQPDFPTPAPIVEAAVKALRDGKTGYGPAPGIPELREAIAESAARLRGIPIAPEQVVVTPGGKPVIFYALNSLAGPGDEVIHPDPGFPMYASIIAHSGARPVPLPLREEADFRFDAGEFRAALSDRTRLVVLNSPGNPTGGVLERKDLEVIAAEAIRRDLWVLADEIYKDFLYEGSFASIASIPGMEERTIILDGFSKSYSMTGWRVGYAIVPPSLLETFELYNVNLVSCTATFSQYGALAALRGPRDSVTAMIAEFRRRRDALTARLERLPGVRSRLPRGAFYAFPNITATGLGDAELARDLLETAGVAVLAGSAFGAAGAGYLRLSYASSMETIERAAERMAAYFEARAS
jgi:aspartate/methionine/tyrosine aminotransferase